MTTNDFQEFLGFIHKITGQRPNELEECLKDVFIYVPGDKKPPEKETINTCSSTSHSISILTYVDKWNKDFQRLIYNGDWKLIESVIGYELLRFCLSDCVLGKKTKTGGFMLSKLTGSEYKSANENRSKKKLDEIFYKSVSASKICAEEKGNNDKSVYSNDEFFDWKEVQKNLLHIFTSSDIEISCDHLILRYSKSKRFSKDHVLTNKKETLSMSQEVIKTQVGNNIISEYENCLEQLEDILKEFKKNHVKYNYENSLDGLLLWNEKKSNNNLRNELPISVMKKYFAHICKHVLPMKLFGSNKNLNSVIKNVCDLLDAPRRQSINLRLYISKMNVSDIRWLDEVKNTDTQWILIGKLLKWLFVNFIFEILRTQFYIIVIPPSTKKIYFKQSDWQKSITSFVKKLYKDKVLEKVDGLCVRGPPVGEWLLFPKKNGIRPILAARRVGNKKESIQQTLYYLQQLYVTKYGNFNKQVFIERWKDLVKKYENCDKKQLYIVSCDIESAFESIDQRKLIKIIESHVDLSEKSITMKHYKIGKNLRSINSSIPLKTKRFVVYPELELPLSEGSVFAPLSGKPLTIQKEKLLQIMRSHVLNQHVIIKNQRFVLRNGIAQGAILSPILCDLYYANMIDEKLSPFRDQAFLYRYVDDFLFVTDDRILAEEFLEQIKTGFPDYNCVFTTAKTKTNLPGHETPLENINYLGYNINVRNLEVTLEYPKDSRYSTIASKPRTDILKNFRLRLCNLAHLKLDGLVLDSKVNSEDTIVNTVKCAFIKQAERCLCLLRTMFDDIRKNVASILKIIKSTNLKIFCIVRRHLNASGFDFEKLVPRLAVLPWKSYRQVFGKIQSIHKHFRLIFLMNIKMTKNLERS